MARLHLHVCGGKPQDHWAHEDVALDSRTRPSGSIRAPPSKRTNTLIKTPLKRQQKPRRRPGFYFFLNAKKSTHFANTIAGEHGDSFIHLIDATQALTLTKTRAPPVVPFLHTPPTSPVLSQGKKMQKNPNSCTKKLYSRTRRSK